MKLIILATVAAVVLAAPGFADAPVIRNVSVKNSNNLWSFSVAVFHKDDGWDDYVTGWRILDPLGNEIAVRNLHLPQVGATTNTRSLSGVAIDPRIDLVFIEARDSILGWTGKKYRVSLE